MLRVAIVAGLIAAAVFAVVEAMPH